MGCFSCIGESSSSNKKPQRDRANNSRNDHARPPKDLQKVSPHNVTDEPEVVMNQSGQMDTVGERNTSKFKARRFTFQELVAATKNFKEEFFLGEGGFGKVYKGCLPRSNEIVAIKQLDRNGCQGHKEFVVESMTLSKGEHDNLVRLIGYCADGGERLLVYEYMPLGSLENHLYEPQGSPLDWNTRIKIAAGAAKGLEYLHKTMKIIYRDLKCSNILLGEGYHAKLSDFGLAKVGPTGAATHVSTRVMGTYGYCAPEYAMTGQLTFKADIYSFGVVLLELITGRRALDLKRGTSEQKIVDWARPLFKDRKNFSRMADPMLQGRYPVRGLNQALAIAAMCVGVDTGFRPEIGDIVSALNYLSSRPYDPNQIPRRNPSSPRIIRGDVEKKPVDGNREE